MQNVSGVPETVKKQLQVTLEKERVMRCGPGPVILGHVLSQQGEREREKESVHTYTQYLLSIYSGAASERTQ